MLATIGWLALLLPLGWISLFAFFMTVPTWSGALFSMQWYYKLLGILAWAIVLSLWLLWFSVIEINI